MNTCKFCKKEFTAAKHHPNQETCSPRCYKRIQAAKNRPQGLRNYRFAFETGKTPVRGG